jgi:endonuclease-3
VNIVTADLFRYFPDPASLATSDLQILEAIIRSTGLFRNKAINLKRMALALIERHNGQIPTKKEQLTKLPGVGPKTANVVLANAFGIPAFAVDTHVYRTTRRLGLSQSTTAGRVEVDICKLFPKICWIALHHQLVSHGRKVCYARKPNCGSCLLSDMCPTGLGNMRDPHTGIYMW